MRGFINDKWRIFSTMNKKPILDIGEIWLAKHTDDNGKTNYHPFLIVLIMNGKAYGLQFSSFKKQIDGSYKSYFSSEEDIENIYFNFMNLLFNQTKKMTKTIELDGDDGMDNWSEAALHTLQVFNLKNSFIDQYNFKKKASLELDKFYEIIKLLNHSDWENESINWELAATQRWLEIKLNI